MSKGSVISSLCITEADQLEDTINCFALCNEDTGIITHHKSGLFKLWDWKSNRLNFHFLLFSIFLFATLLYILFLFMLVIANKLMKLWKSIHKGPVMQITLSNNSILMASGGSDGSVRLWNLQHHACTHNFKGIQGVVR